MFIYALAVNFIKNWFTAEFFENSLDKRLETVTRLLVNR